VTGASVSPPGGPGVPPLRITDVPLEDLLPYLSGRQSSGTLTVTTRHYRKKVFLADGRLAGVASDNPRDLLGHVLVGWNLISEEQLSEAMQIHERLGAPLGRILETAGAIDDESLQRALQAQAEEALLELFLMPEEDKRWLENVLPSDRPLSLRLPLVDLVLEGRRRRERFSALKELLGGLDVVPRRTLAEPPADLSGRDLHILTEVDGEKDLEAIALGCHVVTFLVAEFVGRGVRDGYLEIVRAERGAVPVTSASLIAKGNEALREHDLARVWQILDDLRPLAADEATWLEVGRLQQRLAEASAQRRVAGTAIPVLCADVPVASGLLPSEAFVLSRVNDRWSLRDIQRITPVDELEFGTIVDSLLRRGLIVLREP
jgi:hypothetical protein